MTALYVIAAIIVATGILLAFVLCRAAAMGDQTVVFEPREDEQP